MGSSAVVEVLVQPIRKTKERQQSILMGCAWIISFILPNTSGSLTVLSSAGRDMITQYHFAALPWSAAANR